MKTVSPANLFHSKVGISASEKDHKKPEYMLYRHRKLGFEGRGLPMLKDRGAGVETYRGYHCP